MDLDERYCGRDGGSQHPSCGDRLPLKATDHTDFLVEECQCYLHIIAISSPHCLPLCLRAHYVYADKPRTHFNATSALRFTSLITKTNDTVLVLQ